MHVQSRLIFISCVLINCISIVVLIGWVLGEGTIITFSSAQEVSDGIASMKPVTALCFMAFTFVIYLDLKKKHASARIVSLLIFACAFINILIHVTDWLSILELEKMMSIATACIFMLSVGVFLLCNTQRTPKAVSDILLLIAFYMTLYSIYGYIINYKALYSIYAFSSLSIPTSLAFMLLSFSLSLLYPEGGILGIFYQESLGGFVAKRILLIAFVFPILTGLIIVSTIHGQRISYELGIIIVFTVLSLVILSLGFYVSCIVHKIDRKNLSLLKQATTYNQELEIKEARLEQQNERLQTINQYLDNFVHAVVHKLRGGITNLDSLLEIRNDTPPHQVAMVDDKIKMSVHQLDDTLINLIRLIELQNEKDFEVSVLQFEDTLNKIIIKHQTELQEAQADITFDFSECKQVCYNAQYLEKIIGFLITNSLIYRYSERPLKIHIKSWQKDGFTMLKISDNGIGIRSTIDHMEAFAPFKRLTNIGKGKGLGLFIVKSMVEKNGGKVSISSKYEQGTDICIALKAYEALLQA